MFKYLNYRRIHDDVDSVPLAVANMVEDLLEGDLEEFKVFDREYKLTIYRNSFYYKTYLINDGKLWKIGCDDR